MTKGDEFHDGGWIGISVWSPHRSADSLIPDGYGLGSSLSSFCTRDTLSSGEASAKPYTYNQRRLDPTERVKAQRLMLLGHSFWTVAKHFRMRALDLRAQLEGAATTSCH